MNRKAALASIIASSILLAACLNAAPEFSYRNGLMEYHPTPPTVINETNFTAFDKASVTKIFFQNRNATIAAIIRKPANDRGACIVLLPGALVKKEGEDASVGRVLAQAGFTVITLDQRGTGETNGNATPQEDYESFTAGRDATGHKMVADAIQAANILEQRGCSRALFAGESMGGRNALMAAALTNKPAIGISTSGIAASEDTPEQAKAYVKSLDPQAYAELLSQRVAMLHGPDDAVVPINAGLLLFAKINSQKKFAQLPCADHGYCNKAAAQVADAALWAAGLEN